MTVVKRISKNIVSLVTIEIVNQLTLVILALVLPRFLGAAGFGNYSTAMSFTVLFTIFLDMGLRSLTLLNVSKNKNLTEKYFSNILMMKLFLAASAFFSMVFISSILNYPLEIKLTIYILGISLILNAFSEVPRSIFYANEKMEYGTLTISISKIIITILACIFLFLGYGIIQVAIAHLTGNLIALFLNIKIYNDHFGKPKIEFDSQFEKKLIKMTMPFGLAIIFNNIFFNFDIVIVSHYLGSTVAGWYSLAFYIINILIIFTYTISNALFPSFSKFHVESKEKLILVYKKSLRYLIILVIPIPFILYPLADQIITLLFTTKFSNSVIIFRTLIWVLIPITLARFLEVILAIIEKQKTVTFILGLFSMLNIILDLSLVPLIGYWGAIIAALVSQTLVFSSDLFFVSRYLYKISFVKIIYRPLIASVIVLLVLKTMNSFNFVVLLAIGITVYFVLLLIMKTFKKEDLELIKKIIQKSED